MRGGRSNAINCLSWLCFNLRSLSHLMTPIGVYASYHYSQRCAFKDFAQRSPGASVGAIRVFVPRLGEKRALIYHCL